MDYYNILDLNNEELFLYFKEKYFDKNKNPTYSFKNTGYYIKFDLLFKGINLLNIAYWKNDPIEVACSFYFSEEITESEIKTILAYIHRKKIIDGLL